MSWLAIHMLVELLIAAALGGAIGWALHARRTREAGAGASDAEHRLKFAELDTALRQERDETQALRDRLRTAGVAASAAGQDAPSEATLAWRNRYLESRVRFLEGKLSESELPPAPVKNDAPDETTRLRWRNRYLEGRIRYLEEELVSDGVMIPAADTDPSSRASSSGRSPVRNSPSDADKPATLEAPRGGAADDLKEISGVGPKLERVLNGLGVWHFDQIASWSQREVDWINASINFRSRVERENWIEQARQLAQGIETEGKRRYHDGKQT